MAEIANASFGGSALAAGYTSDHRVDASHTVASGNLTLTATATANSQAIVRKTDGVAMADTDTFTVHLLSADAFRLLLAVRTAAGDATFLPAVTNNADGNIYTSYYRVSTGAGGLRQLGPSIGAGLFVRFRRSGATSLVVETSATYGGSFTVLDTFLESDGLWTATWTAAQAEVGTVGGAGSVVLAALGDGTDPAVSTSASLLQYMRDQARMAGIHFY